MADPNVVVNPVDVSAGNDPANRETPNDNGNRADTSRAGDEAAKKAAFTYEEDRSKWIDPSKLTHRFTEVEKRAAARAAKETEDRFKAELDSRDKRIRALAGVDPIDPQGLEDQKVLSELKRMGVITLSQEEYDDFKKLRESASGIEAATLSVHERHAESMIVQVEQQVEDELGKELTARQHRALRRAYRDAAEEAFMARQEDPAHDPSNDFLARHDRGDKTLAKEVADQFLQDWVEPVRRKVTNEAVTRNRPVPRAGGKPITTQPKPLDLSKPGAFEEALASARRDEGRGYHE